MQPVFALATALRELGQDVHLCVPPNFVEWAHRLGFAATSVGIEMRAPRAGAAAPPAPIPDLIADQFDAIGAAAVDRDVILGANAHQYAARSIAELRGVPYVNALYAPTALPNDENARAWNERSLGRVNANRARLGLAPVADVLRHIVTDRPWLAADDILAPAPSGDALSISQTGAWFLEDRSPLDADLEEFLDRGEPPIYFGFGSMPVTDGTAPALLDAARRAGRRAVIARGWSDMPVEAAADCIVVDEINQQALFPRVAAVVHHGGAGTTFTAARAGVPQVVTPMYGDQFFWGARAEALDIGRSLPFRELSADRLVSALHDVGNATTIDRARSMSARVRTDGARVAARMLLETVAQ